MRRRPRRPRRPKRASSPKVGQRSSLIRRVKNLRIERISLLDPVGGSRIVLETRRRHRRGARQKFTVYDFRDDLIAHPNDSINQRAKRLGLSRRTIARLKREHESGQHFEFRGPVLLLK